MSKFFNIRPFLKIANLQQFVRNVSRYSTESIKSWDEIPGPKALPFIGPLHNFFPGGMFYKLNGDQVFEKLNNLYGPIIKLPGSFGRPDMVFLFDPETTAQVLRAEDTMPTRPGFQSMEYYRYQYKKRKTSGLLTDAGSIWKQFRTKVNPVMLQPKTIKLYENSIDEVSRDMITRLKFLRDKNNMLPENFGKEMNLWALESIAVVALGCRLNSFDINLPDDSPAKKLVNCVRQIFLISIDLDIMPSLWLYYPTKTFKRAMKLYEEQEQLAKSFIEKAEEDIKCRKSEVLEDEKGVLEKLLQVDKYIAYTMATDMLLAGVDTTSNSITAMLYLLAVNPAKQNKLREEIVIGKEKKYLKACIKEALRMIPVVAGNMRIVNKEYNLFGYRIPIGSRVGFAHQAMSNMEKNFVKSKNFIPERWIVAKDDPLYYGQAHPFAYTPFGFGTRSCIGRRIAELEMETFVTRIIESFRIEWSGPPPKIVSTSLNYMTGPFGFKLIDI